MIDFWSTIQATLKGRRIFADIVGNSQQSPTLGLTKSCGKFCTAFGGSFQMLGNGLHFTSFFDMCIIH